MSIEYIPLNLITYDEQLQSRLITDQQLIGKYAQMMTDGIEFDPVRLAYDGRTYWIIDGNHRVQAARAAGVQALAAMVIEASRRHAYFEALAANGRHGAALSNEDKHKAVMAILTDSEWRLMSDREIVRHLGAVSQPFVSSRRRCIDLVMADDPQLTDDEILERAGSYKITRDLIATIRQQLSRPEPLHRKFPVGLWVRWYQGNHRAVGLITAHHGNVAQIDAVLTSTHERNIYDIAMHLLYPAGEIEKFKAWQYMHDGYNVYEYADHYISFTWSNDLNKHGYNVKIDSVDGIAYRLSAAYVDHIESGQPVNRWKQSDLPEHIAALVNRAGAMRTMDRMVYPPEAQPAEQPAQPATAVQPAINLDRIRATMQIARNLQQQEAAKSDNGYQADTASEYDDIRIMLDDLICQAQAGAYRNVAEQIRAIRAFLQMIEDEQRQSVRVKL